MNTENWCRENYEDGDFGWNEVNDLIEDERKVARAEGYRAGIEAAAKLTEQYVAGSRYGERAGYLSLLDRIRALSQPREPTPSHAGAPDWSKPSHDGFRARVASPACAHANVAKEPTKGRRVCRDCGAVAPDLRPEGTPEWSPPPHDGEGAP